MTNKDENLEKRIVPAGDKGVIGERDDMFHPAVSGKRVQFEHVQRYRFALQHIKSNKKVLDLGCGTGYGSYLCFQAQNEVYSLDISEKAINYAQQYYPGPHYFIGSAGKLPFEDEFFDAIIAYEIIEHVENPDEVIKEIYRVLKTGGLLFISSPNRKNFYTIFKHIFFHQPYGEKINKKNIYHIKEFTYSEFIDFIKANNFIIQFQYGQPFVFPWSYSHKVWQFLLEKIPFFISFPIIKYAWTIIFYAKKKEKLE